MLKTCSNHDLLWSEDGEGTDLSRGERSDKNFLKSLRDLGLSVGDEGEGELGVLECFKLSGQPKPEVGRGYL